MNLLKCLMAAQASHVVYADKALKTILRDRKVNEKEYFLGTLFPDIRYLAKLSRQSTHLAKVTVDDLSLAKTDFDLGYLVHSLVDLERNSIIDNLDLYGFMENGFGGQSIAKYAEDHHNYTRFSEWDKIIRFMDDVNEEELTIINDIDLIHEWHRIMKQYLSTPPSSESIADYFLSTDKIELPVSYQQLYTRFSNDQRIKISTDQIFKQMFREDSA